MTKEELTWEKKDFTSIAQTAINAAATIHQGTGVDPAKVLVDAEVFYAFIVGKRNLQSQLQGMPIETAPKAPVINTAEQFDIPTEEPTTSGKVLGGTCVDCGQGVYRKSAKGNLYCSAKCWLK
jgi:hypothetical protein